MSCLRLVELQVANLVERKPWRVYLEALTKGRVSDDLVHGSSKCLIAELTSPS